MMSSDKNKNNQEKNISWTSIEIIGELILLGFMMVLIIAYLIELPEIKWAGRYLPLLAITMGLPFWFLRVRTVLARKSALQQGMVMDLGFKLGEDPSGEKQRAILYIGSILGLFILVWVIGFHIGLPAWVVGYLVVYAKMKWRYALIAGIGFEAFIIAILDLTIDIGWPEPLIFKLTNIAYPFNDMFSRAF
jgi:hypothetical protein